ncbi:hypothetical protein AAHE18_03G179100 [Arachis hypogaea]
MRTSPYTFARQAPPDALQIFKHIEYNIGKRLLTSFLTSIPIWHSLKYAIHISPHVSYCSNFSNFRPCTTASKHAPNKSFTHEQPTIGPPDPPSLSILPSLTSLPHKYFLQELFYWAHKRLGHKASKVALPIPFKKPHSFCAFTADH